jgi:putative flippase GtrA
MDDMLRTLVEHASVKRLISHIPPGQFVRYLFVGLWNTGFGYATFAGFTYLFSLRWPAYGYILGGLVSSVFNISVAFLGYKWFVFKTHGDYLKEWLRCVAVYSSNIAVGLVVLPILVFLLRHLTTMDQKAPYVGAALMTGFNAIYNFVGHKQFSFRRAPQTQAGTVTTVI